MAQTSVTVSAIYRQGALYPLTPLHLPEGTPVLMALQLSQDSSPNDFAALQGIWAGLGDPTFEEIEAITHEAAEGHLHSLLSDFTEQCPLT